MTTFNGPGSVGGKIASRGGFGSPGGASGGKPARRSAGRAGSPTAKSASAVTSSPRPQRRKVMGERIGGEGRSLSRRGGAAAGNRRGKALLRGFPDFRMPADYSPRPGRAAPPSPTPPVTEGFGERFLRLSRKMLTRLNPLTAIGAGIVLPDRVGDGTLTPEALEQYIAEVTAPEVWEGPITRTEQSIEIEILPGISRFNPVQTPVKVGYLDLPEVPEDPYDYQREMEALTQGQQPPGTLPGTRVRWRVDIEVPPPGRFSNRPRGRTRPRVRGRIRLPRLKLSEETETLPKLRPDYRKDWKVSVKERRKKGGVVIYELGLLTINRTLGEATEVRDIAEALAWNTYDGNQLAMNTNGRSMLETIGGIAAGEYSVDWAGFAADVAVMNLSDWAIGKLSRQGQDWLNDAGWSSPVGFTAGPAI